MKKNIRIGTKIVGKKKHGFRRRMSSRTGRQVLRRRRLKGRTRLSL